MPSQICNEERTALISPAGGSIEVSYFDFRDASGQPREIGLSFLKPTPAFAIDPKALQVNNNEFTIPEYKKTIDVIVSGHITDYKEGTYVVLTIIKPDMSTEELRAYATKNGDYTTKINLKHDSLIGSYTISAKYQNSEIGSAHFDVMSPRVPSWIKNDAKSWSMNEISSSHFIDDINQMIKERIITAPVSESAEPTKQKIPEWVKNIARWWADGLISEKDFVGGIEFLVKEGIIQV